MTGTVRPETPAELIDAVIDARATGVPLWIHGGDSMAGFGAEPAGGVRRLDMRCFAGVVDYDPAELVLTVGAGTPLAEVAAVVAKRGQMLAFEPFDHGPLHGRAAGAATIGGAVAGAVGGSQRLALGGPRDHLLGFKAVTGRGELVTAGAKVVKNVTGYDLPKLACGSRGQLFALIELTLRVVPAPRAQHTLVLEGLDFPDAVRAMATALGSPAEVVAAAHLPGDPARTILRLQGFGPSVAARAASLARLLGGHGRVRDADEAEATILWASLQTIAPLGRDRPLWRIGAPPARAPEAVAALGGEWLADWAGGLLWLASEVPAEGIRATVVAFGGHATLMRGPASLRAAVPALHPPAPGVAALEARVRAAFDPEGVFACGRFGETRP